MIDWKTSAKTAAAVFCVGVSMTMTTIAAEPCPEQFGVVQLQELAKIDPAQIRAAPMNGHLRDFFAKLSQISACEIAVNHFAAELGLPKDLVEQKSETAVPRLITRYGNASYPELCGTVVMTVAYGIEPATPAPPAPLSIAGIRRELGLFFAGSEARKADALRKSENTAFRELTGRFDAAYFKISSDVHSYTDNLVQRFMPAGRYLAQPTTEHLQELTKTFELTLVETFKTFLSEQKWSAAEVDHFLGRARCSAVLPVIAGPDETKLANYRSAMEAYRPFTAFMESDFKH